MHNYGKMYYKNGHCIGIRRKFDLCDTAFSFGGKRCKLSEERLRQYGDQVVDKLHAGEKEADVKAWIKEIIGWADHASGRGWDS